MCQANGREARGVVSARSWFISHAMANRAPRIVVCPDWLFLKPALAARWNPGGKRCLAVYSNLMATMP